MQLEYIPLAHVALRVQMLQHLVGWRNLSRKRISSHAIDGTLVWLDYILSPSISSNLSQPRDLVAYGRPHEMCCSVGDGRCALYLNRMMCPMVSISFDYHHKP